MKHQEVEHQILELVFRTNLRLTTGLVAYRLGLSCAEARARLSALVSEGALELTSDEQGSLYYTAPGALRPEKDEIVGRAPCALRAPEGGFLGRVLLLVSCLTWASVLLIWISLRLGPLGLIFCGLSLLTYLTTRHACRWVSTPSCSPEGRSGEAPPTFTHPLL